CNPWTHFYHLNRLHVAGVFVPVRHCLQTRLADGHFGDRRRDRFGRRTGDQQENDGNRGQALLHARNHKGPLVAGARRPGEKKRIISARTWSASTGLHAPRLSRSSLRGLHKIIARAPVMNSKRQRKSANGSFGRLACSARRKAARTSACWLRRK